MKPKVRAATRFPLDPDPDDPLIGARLRLALAQIEQRVSAALVAAGFTDINSAHYKVLRFPPPENERPMDLARRAGMTKQAMNYLLTNLEQLGYVHRVAEAGSSNRLVSLTEKGWEVARIQRANVRAVEQEWALRFGEDRFRVFYDVLCSLTD